MRRQPGAVDTRGVLVFGPKTLQSRRDDEVRERQRRGDEHDDDAGRPEELAVDVCVLMPRARTRRRRAASRSVQPSVIIHVGIMSKSHMAIVQNRRPKTLVRCTSHAMVVAIATAKSDTTRRDPERVEDGLARSIPETPGG